VRGLLNLFSKRPLYRLVSIPLALASILVPLGVVVTGGWGWLAVVLGLPLYVTLVLLTYYRLREADLSSGWLILMILSFHIGPTWELPGGLTFYPTGLIAMIPVVLAWFVPSRAARVEV